MSVPRYLMDEKGVYLNPECPDLGLLFSSPAGKLTIEDIKSVRIPVDVFSGEASVLSLAARFPAKSCKPLRFCKLQTTCVKYILPKLLETRLTQTKQTTEPAISRHKTATPPHAISPHPCSAGPALVRHCGVPQHAPQPPMPDEDDSEERNAWRPPARHLPLSPIRLRKASFLIDRPKRLKTAATQTKQTSEVISNRMKIRGVSQIQSGGKSHGDSHVARGSCPVYPESRRDEGRVRPEAFEFRPYSIAPEQGAIPA